MYPHRIRFLVDISVDLMPAIVDFANVLIAINLEALVTLTSSPSMQQSYAASATSES